MTKPWQIPFSSFVGPYSLTGENFSIDDETAEETTEVVSDCLDGSEELLWSSDDGRLSIVWIVEFGDMGAAVLLDTTEDGKRIAGWYQNLCLWMDPVYRGCELTERLILAVADKRDGSPVADEPAVGFTDAGMRAHVRAHRLAVSEALSRGCDVPREVRAEYPDL